MRMRKKKHSSERIEKCADLLIKYPIDLFGHEDTLFGKGTPLLLEIGCGKGDFATGLSLKYPKFGIIAVERVPDVAMFALEKATSTINTRPDNLRFIIGNAEYITDWFSSKIFSCIYINFCDPWPKKGYFKRRLTAPSYLEKYKKIIVPGGELHFKTDNESLFDWSLKQFEESGLDLIYVTRDLHNSKFAIDNIETEYEHRFVSMGQNIFSAHIRFPEIISEVDNDE